MQQILDTLRSWKAADWLLAAGLLVSVALACHVPYLTSDNAGTVQAQLAAALPALATVIASAIAVVKVLRHQGRQGPPQDPPQGDGEDPATLPIRPA